MTTTARHRDTSCVHRSWTLTRLLSPIFSCSAFAVLVHGRDVRMLEAATQHVLLSFGRMRSSHVGTAVTFPVDGRLVGIAFSTGCSVGPLIGLFLLCAAVVAWIRPLRLRAVLGGVLAVACIFVVANQLRIAVIVTAMHVWGFRHGYDLSHVFLGSTITTIGFVLGVLAFVRLLLPGHSGGAA